MTSLIDIDNYIFKNVTIDTDIFTKGLIDIDIFKNGHIDINIDIFKKCQYIDNRYCLSIYRTPLFPIQKMVENQLLPLD